MRVRRFIFVSGNLRFISCLFCSCMNTVVSDMTITTAAVCFRCITASHSDSDLSSLCPPPQHATRPVRLAVAPPRLTVPLAPTWPPYRVATARRAARRGSSSILSLESASVSPHLGLYVCVFGCGGRGWGVLHATASGYDDVGNFPPSLQQ